MSNESKSLYDMWASSHPFQLEPIPLVLSPAKRAELFAACLKRVADVKDFRARFAGKTFLPSNNRQEANS